KTSEIRVLLYSHSTTQLVYNKTYSSAEKQIKIDTSKLPNGIYHLNIIENGEKIKEQTIIINH
ncbi:MAG: T9SS type A sorting domain-containing protein, partial [Prevotellaceae bacterium]|nr:T9SS type A sorting domain-containing protein [Prevotellaceae bacterium]